MAVASSNLNKTSISTVTKNQKPSTLSETPVTTTKPYSLEVKPVTAVILSNDTAKDDITFPPLLPLTSDIVKKSDSATKDSPFLTFMTKSELVPETSTENTNKSENVKEEEPEKHITETVKVDKMIQESEVSKNTNDTTVKAATTSSRSSSRKPKFEFNKTNSSVIFLDEIKKTKSLNKKVSANENKLVKAQSDTHSLDKEKVTRRTNDLNGIKFGFIDSTSSSATSDEEEIAESNKDQEVIIRDLLLMKL